MKTDPIEISGITLVDKVFEFRNMVSAEKTVEDIKDNPPRFVRFLQIEALLKYFTPEVFDTGNVFEGIDKLLKGLFILQRDINLYENLIKIMDTSISSKCRNGFEKGISLENLRHNYAEILRFKSIINAMLNFNNGIIEISYPYLYSVIMTEEFSKKMDYKQIDEFLSLVIDPRGRTVSKSELVADFNYPKVDIYDIDLDWY